jgi:Ankyrin repeats (3 copies)/NACHT domain/Ankyrin repeats (many copies)/Ankyrin repeat
LKALWHTNPSLTDPAEDRKALIDKKGSRAGGTCEWIVGDEIYKSWLRSRSQLLWLSGGPGKGKTMLSIFLAEELEQVARKSQDAIFIQYFCDNKDRRRNTAVAILRGLTYQLLKLCPDLIDHILPTFKIQRESLFSDSSFGSLWTCFESMVRDPSLGVVYCVVDGLDECDEALLEVLLKRLRDLFSPNANLPSTCHLNLIAVSRERPDSVSRELSDFPRIRLDPDADSHVNSDIERFITVKVDEVSRYRNYPPQLRSYVEDVFRKRAEGTFLWVGIIAKELEKYTCDEVKDALDSFPPGLDELYGRMLRHIPSRRRETTAKILRWVVVAVRPLTLLELSTAIRITAEDSSGLSCQEMMRAQVSHCGHLLTITNTPTGQEVGLIHQSAKDYLLRETRDPIAELEFFRIKKETANLEVARRCLGYLQDSPLLTRAVYLSEDTQDLKAFPLLSYAALHWIDHARRLSDPSSDVFDLSLAFYADRSPVRDSWWRTYCDSKGVYLRGSFSLLHIASYCDIVPLAERLLCRSWWRNYVKLNAKDSDGTTVLHEAARSGNEAMVRLLLEKGANLKTKGRRGETVLHVAAWSGNEAMVRLLLEKGANLKTKDRRGETVLHVAAGSGNEAMVRLLLEKGAGLKAKDEDGTTVLHWAAWSGDEATIRLLVEKGADPKAKKEDGTTVLHEAARSGNEAMVRLLLEKGADPKAKNKNGQAVLYGADNEAIRWLLLEKRSGS